MPAAPASDGESVEPDVRFSYANERTFLAWVRTALGLVTAGLAVTQLLPPFDFAGGRRIIGLPLIALGVVIAVASLYNWRANERAMRAGLPLPRSAIPAITASRSASSCCSSAASSRFSAPGMRDRRPNAAPGRRRQLTWRRSQPESPVSASPRS
jgi:putative membrane protein